MSIFHTRVYNELYMNKNANCSPMINEETPIQRQTSVTWSTTDNTVVYFDPKRTKLFSSDTEEDQLEFESETTASESYSDIVCNENIGCLIS